MIFVKPFLYIVCFVKLYFYFSDLVFVEEYKLEKLSPFFKKINWHFNFVGVFHLC